MVSLIQFGRAEALVGLVRPSFPVLFHSLFSRLQTADNKIDSAKRAKKRLRNKKHNNTTANERERERNASKYSNPNNRQVEDEAKNRTDLTGLLHTHSKQAHKEDRNNNTNEWVSEWVKSAIKNSGKTKNENDDSRTRNKKEILITPSPAAVVKKLLIWFRKRILLSRRKKGVEWNELRRRRRKIPGFITSSHDDLKSRVWLDYKSTCQNGETQ